MTLHSPKNIADKRQKQSFTQLIEERCLRILILSLYYNVGRYISNRSRMAQWGTNALSTISLQLQQELIGLRGFSVTNLKRMRTFYEAWNEQILNRPIASDDLK